MPVIFAPVASDADSFDYDAAFARNIGWVTHDEQQVLRSKHVAIAALGGVGGAHLITLARLGVGRFSIADFDRFELPNFNRQAGAAVSTLGQPKTAVLVSQVGEIILTRSCVSSRRA